MAVTTLKKTLIKGIDKRWELRRNVETSIYIQAADLDPRLKSLSFLKAEKWDEAYTTVWDLLRGYLQQKKLMLREDRDSSGDKSEPGPAPKEKWEKQEIAMLIAMATDEVQKTEKQEMKRYLDDRTKVESGPLTWTVI